MKRTISLKAAVAMAAVTVFASLPSAYAQDEGAAEQPAAEGEEQVVQSTAKDKVSFYPLFRVTAVNGSVQVLKPTTTDWVPVEMGHYYPLGTSVRVLPNGAKDVSVEVSFGDECKLTAVGAAEFATLPPTDEKSRAVTIASGTFNVALPLTLPEGAFAVKMKTVSCKNLSGESRIECVATGDGEEVLVRCVTGMLALDGRHFRVAKMGVANQLRMRSTGDELFTSIRGESGDCKVTLEQGVTEQKDFETGEVKSVVRTLEYSLTPKCAIKIHRAKTASEGRMIVSTMTFDAQGELKNRCVFAEGLPFLNSGELVFSQKNVEESAKVKPEDGEAESKADEGEEKKDEDSGL